MEKVKIPLLAFDGGGTKSLVVLTDEEGNRLGQGRGGPCNYQGVGKERAKREIAQGIHEALLDFGITGHPTVHPSIEIDCAVLGIAGLDSEYDREIIMGIVKDALDSLSLHVRHLVVHNDGLAALLGATAGQPGVLAIAGTGSIVFGINEFGQTVRTGGWGHRVGDEGSGYWIGKQAVTAILRAHDGRGVTTRLQEWVLPSMGFNHAEELFNWVYSSDYSVDKLGEISQLVSMAAAVGDHEAHRILIAAGDELFVCVQAVVRQLTLTDKPFNMILQGGVLQNISLVRERLISKIAEHMPEALLIEAHEEPINGVTSMGLAYLRAMSSEESGSVRLQSECCSAKH